MIRHVPRAKYQDIRASKQMYKKIMEAKRKVNDETNLQIDILYHAAAIALHRYYGWTDKEIVNFFHAAETAGEDCSTNFEMSMIELCWDELGIELMAEGIEKRWFEVSFLASEQDIDRMQMDQFKYYEFYKNQIPWIAAQITASILLALHRSGGWKDKACGSFIKKLEDVKYEFNKEPELLRNTCMKECHVALSDGFWVFDNKEEKK